MPNFSDDTLWWLLLGVFVGWLLFWLVDKLFRRDGEYAAAKERGEIASLTSQLGETQNENARIRTDLDERMAETQKLTDVNEELRDSINSREQQITNLETALDAAREQQSSRSPGSTPAIAPVSTARPASPIVSPAAPAKIDKPEEPGKAEQPAKTEKPGISTGAKGGSSAGARLIAGMSGAAAAAAAVTGVTARDAEQADSVSKASPPTGNDEQDDRPGREQPDIGSRREPPVADTADAQQTDTDSSQAPGATDTTDEGVDFDLPVSDDPGKIAQLDEQFSVFEPDHQATDEDDGSLAARLGLDAQDDLGPPDNDDRPRQTLLDRLRNSLSGRRSEDQD